MSGSKSAVKATVRLSDLVLIPGLYPRERLDDDRVEWMRDVLEAGGSVPPIVVDERNRLVDGAHRVAAYRLVKGGDAGVECEVRKYASDAEFLLDAIRLNAGHGKPLGDGDRARCVALARKQSVSVERLASVLNVRVERVEGMARTRPVGGATAATAVAARPGHARHRGNGGPVAATGLDLLNRAMLALRDGHVNVRDRQIRQTVRALVKVALERLKETEDMV